MRIASRATPDGALPPAEYRQIVAEFVTGLASRFQPGTDLYGRSLGAFPTIVKESLESAGQALPAGGESGNPGAGAGEPPPAWEDDELDPIDAQWYFDRETVSRLASMIPSGPCSVLAMGVPTLAAPAARAGHEVMLLDRSHALRGKTFSLEDRQVATRLSVVDWDLGEKPYLDAAADMVIMDPPWYMEHYQAWLHTAVDACAQGGIIAVALPQFLTNRRSLADRRELLGLLGAVGWVKVIPNALSYVTPSFERPVLEGNGIRLLDRWRRADLALLRVERKRLSYEFEPVSDIEWRRREIGGRIVRSWGEFGADGALPVIRPAGPAGDFRLSSVSRSYLRTSGINLVTSRGRAAVVSRWGRLPLVLDLLARGLAAPRAVMTVLPHVPEPDRRQLTRTLETILEP